LLMTRPLSLAFCNKPASMRRFNDFRCIRIHRQKKMRFNLPRGETQVCSGDEPLKFFFNPNRFQMRNNRFSPSR